MSTGYGQVLGFGSQNDPKSSIDQISKLERSELQKQRALKNLRSNNQSSTQSTGSMFGTGLGSNTLQNNMFMLSKSAPNPLIKPQTFVDKYFEKSNSIVLPPLSTTSPIQLGSHCISNAITKDNLTPALYDVFTNYLVDNYNYKPNNVNDDLGTFSRFEKTNIYNIPDKILESYTNVDSISTMGLFPEINKAWLTVDNKLFIWNYQAVGLEQEYFTIDEFQHSILTVHLVKPKPNIFVDSVNYLLIVSTSSHIHVLAVEYTSKSLEIANLDMSVSTQGLYVNKIVAFDKTGDIFFTCVGDSENIWKLTYSNAGEWFQRTCSKECLTRTSLTSVLPGASLFSKIPGLSSLASSTTEQTANGSKQSSSTSASALAAATAQLASKSEVVAQLEIDQSRSILYTLSSKSIIRAYRLNVVDNKAVLGTCVTKTPLTILKDLATTSTSYQSPLLNRTKLKIVSITPVSSYENSKVFLIAVTSMGCRIYINGNSIVEFSPLQTANRLASSNRLSLNASFVKFPPPTKAYFEEIEKLKLEQREKEQGYLNTNELLSSNGGNKTITKGSIKTNTNYSLNINIPQKLKQAQESSTLLQDVNKSLIVSPGIYFGTTSTNLFVSTPDYGVLKESFQYIEDFEFLDLNPSTIKEIVQLTPTFNATEKPEGYCNVFASQYTKQPLEIAVLTNSGIHVYMYRTPDMILEDSLEEKTFKEMVAKYGSIEACSTALYLACKYRKSDISKNLATNFFISGGQDSKLNKNLVPVIDNVELSDRFNSSLLLISRLVREFWNKDVFTIDSKASYGKDGFIVASSLSALKNPKALLTGVNLKKTDIEYFLCSLIPIINFFETNQKSIPGLSTPNHSFNYSSSSSNVNSKENEVRFQAEHIGFNGIMKLLKNMKEGLSFLAILLDDSEEALNSSKNFLEIISFIPLQTQIDLSCLTFNDFFTSSDPNVQSVIKEVLSAIINRSIASRNSVEFVASTLQEKCGSFCSAGDVLIFKAMESLKKAKDISEKDPDLKLRFLQAAITVLEKASDLLNIDTIKDAVNLMVQLDFYPGSIEFLLNVANSGDSAKLSLQFNEVANDAFNDNSTASNDPKKIAYERRVQLYSLVFDILIDIDRKAFESVSNASSHHFSSNVVYSANGEIVTKYSQLSDLSYGICYSYQDKLFHYEFYKWFVSQGISERLLDIDTPYVLEFLQDSAANDINMAKLLWIYYSRHENYLAAAQILLELALSAFEIDLANRIQLLSRANGFCNCSCPPNRRQEMITLGSEIVDLIEAANIQDELLLTIDNDDRINQETKVKLILQLNSQILTVSDLFNDYVDPLGYYELSLVIFKISDHRNSEDILSEWESLFNKWRVQYEVLNQKDNEPFYSFLTNKFVLIGSRLSDTEILFPVTETFQLLAKYLYSGEFSELLPSSGLIIDTFIKCGVSHSKLYYTFKDMVESSTFEIFSNSIKVLQEEMVYLIKVWYKRDKKLRNVISNDQIKALTVYSIDSDPVYNYIKTSMTPI